MDYPALPMLEQLLQPPWSSGVCCSGCAVSSLRAQLRMQPVLGMLGRFSGGC